MSVSKFPSVKQIRPDNLVVICSYCPGSKEATVAMEASGKDVTHGICKDCLDKWKMDSLKGSTLEIRV